MARDKLIDDILGAEEGRIREALSAADADTLVSLLRNTSLLKLVALAASQRRGSGSTLSRQALEQLAERHGVAPEHVDQAWELLETGQLGQDLSAVTTVTLKSIGKLPRSVVGFVGGAGNTLAAIPAVLTDVFELPRTLTQIILGGLRRILGREPTVSNTEPSAGLLANTLGEIYKLAPVEVATSWAHEVTGYESVQLAMILYASTHNVNIEEQDLEAARVALRDGDLTPLLVAAFAFLEREGPDKLREFLG